MTKEYKLGDQSYLHGYSKKEQNRLYKQARFLESHVFEGINLTGRKKLLEVGCGVGAQTEILLKRYPQVNITGIDLSQVQIQQALKHLANYVENNRVNLSVENAEEMSFSSNQFDGAVLIWFLEHVLNPVKILKEVRRVLKPGGVISCSEVFNATLYLSPECPAIMEYWNKFNKHQIKMGGDPYVGVKLGDLLRQVGFTKIELIPRTFCIDSRDKKQRTLMLRYWTELLLSAAPVLLESNKVTPQLFQKMKKELKMLSKNMNTTFYYSYMQAKASKLD
jgi:ubiquinone/menaquinone biosynthesis C-methylase UbiE